VYDTVDETAHDTEALIDRFAGQIFSAIIAGGWVGQMPVTNAPDMKRVASLAFDGAEALVNEKNARFPKR